MIIDSGATSHICNNKDVCSADSSEASRLGDGHSLKATAQGTVSVRTVYGRNRSRKCSLTDVLFVPELSYNLLSVHKVVEKGNKVNFSVSSEIEGKDWLLWLCYRTDSIM